MDETAWRALSRASCSVGNRRPPGPFGSESENLALILLSRPTARDLCGTIIWDANSYLHVNVTFEGRTYKNMTLSPCHLQHAVRLLLFHRHVLTFAFLRFCISICKCSSCDWPRCWRPHRQQEHSARRLYSTVRWYSIRILLLHGLIYLNSSVLAGGTADNASFPGPVITGPKVR